MPTIRPRTVVDEKYVEQTKYTLPLDLPNAGIFSTMWLIVHAREDDAPTANEPFMKYLISSLSVNQAGQEALNAARPQAFEASYYYKTGRMPQLGHRQFTDDLGDIEEIIPILFGDKVDDLEHTVDLATLNDPKLSVTYDLATTGLQDGTLWDTSYYPRFSVVIDLIEGEGIPASKGYYSLRQIDQYDVTDDLIKLTALKGARPIKRLLIEDYVPSADYEFRNILDLARIHGDNEAYVPFRMTPERWKNLVREKFGLCEAVPKVYFMYGAKFTDCVVAERQSYDAEPLEDTSHFSYFHGGSGLKSNFNLIKISDGTKGEHIYDPSFLRYVGILPWNVQVVDMPRMLNMEHLDPTLHAPVYLELDYTSEAATYGDTIRVNIEDLVA